MKRYKNPFRLNNGNVKLFHRKAEHELFSDAQKLDFVNLKFSIADRLNVVGISPALFSKFSSQKMLLLNLDSGIYINVSVKCYDSISGTEFVATAYLKEILHLETSENIFLCQYNDIKFEKILLQKIDHIRESDLVISESDYNRFNIKNSPCKFFEVYNTFSNDSIIVKKTHIFTDKSLSPGAIRLNRKQRICLGLELPQYLSEDQWAILEENLDHNSEEYQTICEIYTSSDHIFDKTASYNKKTTAKKTISKYCSGDISIIPIPESIYMKRKRLLQRLCDFYVGKSTISLVCRRPYEIDEGLDIIRMSKCNMNLLGIDEMDKVILQYKNKKISCRVLELGDEGSFMETNLPISLDLAVGVPAHIRKKLNVLDLSSSIKIDRDTAFIFKKNINEQIVPILLTLFSANVFTDASVITSALLSLVAIPIVLYFNLSSKRNMRT